MNVQRELLDRVRAGTGFPVDVMLDESISSCATLRSARPGLPGHVILVNPKFAAQTDYWVAIECFQLLRLWAVPYEQQRDFALDESKERYLATQLERLPYYKRLGQPIASAMAKQLFRGVLMQLRSFPPDIRCNQMLAAEYPQLQDQQRAGVMGMLRDNSQSLRPEIKQISTDQVRNANLSMNAAYAQFWSDQWSDSSIVIPYEAAGFSSNGRQLLGMLRSVPDEGGLEDRQLVDNWAEVFHMNNWYSWTPKVSS